MNNKNSFFSKFKKVIWILTPFILLAVIIILIMKHCESERKCFDCDEMQEKIDDIEQKIKDKDCLDCDWENSDGEEVQKPTENDTIIDGEEVQEPTENDTIIDGEIVQNPTKNCRAHFSGALLTDDAKYGQSVIFQTDQYSEYVGEGEYPRASRAFPKADDHTFDGIAIDKNTRVIIYSRRNFKGNILLDVTGPSLINNIIWKDDPEWPNYKVMLNEVNSKKLNHGLERIFPKSCRRFSKSDMHSWSNGSLKIICNE